MSKPAIFLAKLDTSLVRVCCSAEQQTFVFCRKHNPHTYTHTHTHTWSLNQKDKKESDIRGHVFITKDTAGARENIIKLLADFTTMISCFNQVRKEPNCT